MIRIAAVAILIIVCLRLAACDGTYNDANTSVQKMIAVCDEESFDSKSERKGEMYVTTVTCIIDEEKLDDVLKRQIM